MTGCGLPNLSNRSLPDKLTLDEPHPNFIAAQVPEEPDVLRERWAAILSSDDEQLQSVRQALVGEEGQEWRSVNIFVTVIGPAVIKHTLGTARRPGGLPNLSNPS